MSKLPNRRDAASLRSTGIQAASNIFASALDGLRAQLSAREYLVMLEVLEQVVVREIASTQRRYADIAERRAA